MKNSIYYIYTPYVCVSFFTAFIHAHIHVCIHVIIHTNVYMNNYGVSTLYGDTHECVDITCVLPAGYYQQVHLYM